METIRSLEFSLRRRDAQSGAVRESKVAYDPRRTLIVVIDAWATHWCNTWCGLAGGRVPRLNQAMSIARQLGFTIVHAPTDTAASFTGTPQRERMSGLPRLEMPRGGHAFDLPPFPKGSIGQHCMCTGVPRCMPHYGQRGIDPRMTIAANDLISGDGVEVYTWCMRHGITKVIHAGFATNMCMTGKPEGLAALTAAGLDCAFTRDLTEAWGSNTGAASADRLTAQCCEHLEKFAGPSIDLVAEFRKLGLWDEQWLLDPVRIVPSAVNRPIYFDRSVEVTMTFPLRPEAEIRYTLDGTPPTAASTRFQGPISIDDSKTVQATAYEGGRPVGLVSEVRYVRLPPPPPLPDIYVSDLKPAKTTSLGWIANWSCKENGSALPPQADLSYAGTPLTLREAVYRKGMGVHAPAQLIYNLRPEYERFVARVGMDESILRHDLGRDAADYPSAVFHVFIDGQSMAQSPIMRLGQPPWPIDVAIPREAKVISLSVTDAGDGNREDLADWVDAGFIVRT